jgi:protease I
LQGTFGWPHQPPLCCFPNLGKHFPKYLRKIPFYPWNAILLPEGTYRKRNETRAGMQNKLKGMKVAILATHGFEQSELTEPRQWLEAEGAQCEIISPEAGTIRGWNAKDWGDSVPVDKTLEEVHAQNYDALLLPGGVMNPDQLRMNELAVGLVRAFFEAGKPVAAICHAPQLLIEADVVRGRTLTSYPSVRTDLLNAGAQWVDAEVVSDRGLVTSRRPADLPAFCRTMIEEFGVALLAHPHA